MFGRRFIPKIAAFFPTGTMNNSISRSRNAWLLTGQYNKYASSAKSKRRSKDRLCWKCSAILKSAVEFFCPSCNIIQRPSKTATYFELLNRWKRLFDDLCVTSATPPAADGGGPPPLQVSRKSFSGSNLHQSCWNSKKCFPENTHTTPLETFLFGGRGGGVRMGEVVDLWTPLTTLDTSYLPLKTLTF